MDKDKKKIETLIGFDFGTKRIGVAVGQTITYSATPLTVVNAKKGVPNWSLIKNLKNEWKADAFVVGMPYNVDGTEQFITKEAKKFGKKLEKKFDLPVYFVDERLTTKEANLTLSNTHNKKKLLGNKRMAIDSYAAKIILESFLRLKKHRGNM